jgi:hypothetical protein
MANWIRWWNYASFWKLFGTGIGTVVICLLCGLFIPTPWCLIPIGVLCIIARILIKKIFPNVLEDLAKVMGLDDLLIEMESDNETNKEEAE